MSVATTVLFDRPHREIATLIASRMHDAESTSVISGFLTPMGLEAIAGPIMSRPRSLATLVIGAGTYPAFQALDELIAAGVPNDRLHIHLGRTSETGGRSNPHARYRPMMHSKIYYMDLPGNRACAFVGSHNITQYAMTGLNAEASIMLEGGRQEPEFIAIRAHIAEAQREAVVYDLDNKEAYAWWVREYTEGLRAEIALPMEWETRRTILLFVTSEGGLPNPGDKFYFELPDAIQIQSLNTETHLFIFQTLPDDPLQAIANLSSAMASYTCKTLGADNDRGNIEVVANWRVVNDRPILRPVPAGRFRTETPQNMQQVRAEVRDQGVLPFEYKFDREAKHWIPITSAEAALVVPPRQLGQVVTRRLESWARSDVLLEETRGGGRIAREWRLVKGLEPPASAPREKDQVALRLAAPEAGVFILVSVRRRLLSKMRKKDRDGETLL